MGTMTLRFACCSLVVLALAACSQNASDDPDPPGTVEEEVTLKLGAMDTSAKLGKGAGATKVSFKGGSGSGEVRIRLLKGVSKLGRKAAADRVIQILPRGKTFGLGAART